MRFAILISALIIADAIKPQYPNGKVVSGILTVVAILALYVDAYEFYKKVWKQ